MQKILKKVLTDERFCCNIYITASDKTTWLKGLQTNLQNKAKKHLTTGGR